MDEHKITLIESTTLNDGCGVSPFDMNDSNYLVKLDIDGDLMTYQIQSTFGEIDYMGPHDLVRHFTKYGQSTTGKLDENDFPDDCCLRGCSMVYNLIED